MKLKNRGFTLVELIIIIMILGIFAALSLPRLMNTPNFNLQSGTALVTEDLRYAVNYALSTGIPVKIEFDTEPPSEYSFWQKDSSSGLWVMLLKPASPDHFEITLGEGDYSQLYLSEVDINGTQSLYINSMGIPLDGSLNELTTKASITLNGERKIFIEPVTGMIKST